MASAPTPRFSYQIVHLLCCNAFFTFAVAKEKWSARKKKKKRHCNLKNYMLIPQAQLQLHPTPPSHQPRGRNLSDVEALRQAVCFSVGVPCT